MYAVLEAAGLPHRSPHAFRHTYATIALGAGHDVYYVAKQLGHKDINLTFATYTAGDHGSRPGAVHDVDPPSAVANLRPNPENCVCRPPARAPGSRRWLPRRARGTGPEAGRMSARAI